MKRDQTVLLGVVILAAVLMGLVVLWSVPEYRRATIVESNRQYMAHVRIQSDAPARPTPTPIRPVSRPSPGVSATQPAKEIPAGVEDVP